MLNRNENRQMKMHFVTLEGLMPQEHFLRNLDKAIDFSFIYDKVEHLYSNTGRPSVDPVVLVKMLLIGYLYGIESERKLEQEIQVNIAYRWFIGIELDEPVPDHSTISQLRRRKFSGTTIFQDIFDEIVHKCMKEGLVSGKLLLTDSTHIRANTDNTKREIIEVADTPSEYIQKLDREAYETGFIKESVVYPKKTKAVTKSITDPECGLLNRPGKPNAFCYLNHQTCDADNGITTDVFITKANVNDCTPHTQRLEYQIDKFGFNTEAICADAGYDNCEVYDAMLKRGIKTYIPQKNKPVSHQNYTEDFAPEKFIYDEENDRYICPAGKILKLHNYVKRKGYKRYCANALDCRECPYRQQCINNSKNPRRLERHMHEKARREQVKNVNTPEYFSAMRLRKVWCEGNFAHQKEQHNLRRTFNRGIEKVTEQCLLWVYALNLKRLVKALEKVQISFVLEWI